MNELKIIPLRQLEKFSNEKLIWIAVEEKEHYDFNTITNVTKLLKDRGVEMNNKIIAEVKKLKEEGSYFYKGDPLREEEFTLAKKIDTALSEIDLDEKLERIILYKEFDDLDDEDLNAKFIEISKDILKSKKFGNNNSLKSIENYGIIYQLVKSRQINFNSIDKNLINNVRSLKDKILSNRDRKNGFICLLFGFAMVSYFYFFRKVRVPMGLVFVVVAIGISLIIY